jgi:hypothetical protein
MKSFLHLVELEGLDDRLDLLHHFSSLSAKGAALGASTA